MGLEARCAARWQGARHQGKALLETGEVVFRGDAGARAKLALATLKKLAAKDGTLVLVGPEGELRLELGEVAVAKWLEKIKNPRSRLDKLGVEPGMRVSVIGVDDAELRAELAARGADASFGAKPRPGSELVFFGADATAALARLAALAASLTPAGGIWVVRPKGVKTISEADVRAAAKDAGLVDVKVVAFSATHTAEKLVIPLAKRPK
jgi:hypothetical protein